MARPSRLGDDHLVTCIQNCAQRQVESVLRAHGDKYVLAMPWGVQRFAQSVGDRLAQRQQASCRSVVVVIDVLKCALGGGDDVRRGRRVRPRPG